MFFRSQTIGFLLAFATAGCVSSNSKIENGQYNDNERKFSFAAPESWQQVKEVPENFMPRRIGSQDPKCLNCHSDLIFENSDGSGVIAIVVGQSVIDASKVSPQNITKIMEDVHSARQQSLSTSLQIHDYHFQATPASVTEQPRSLCSEQFRYSTQKDFVYESRLFVFMNNEKTCSFRAILLSDAANLQENRQVFDRLLKTLRRTTPETIASRPSAPQTPSSPPGPFSRSTPASNEPGKPSS